MQKQVRQNKSCSLWYNIYTSDTFFERLAKLFVQQHTHSLIDFCCGVNFINFSVFDELLKTHYRKINNAVFNGYIVNKHW